MSFYAKASLFSSLEPFTKNVAYTGEKDKNSLFDGKSIDVKNYNGTMKEWTEKGGSVEFPSTISYEVTLGCKRLIHVWKLTSYSVLYSPSNDMLI